MEEKNLAEENIQKNISENKVKDINFGVISILICSVIYSIVNIFSSTFLIANLYSTNKSPIITIATYYIITYIFISLFYFILAHFDENVKLREWIYRIGVMGKCLFIFLIVLLKDSFQNYIAIFAILNGTTEAFYWSSYTIMKQSIVRRHFLKKFSLIETIEGKIANMVFPIILGGLIDIESFVKVAVPVLIFSLIEVIFSFFVRSKEVKKSAFNLPQFWKKISDQKQWKLFGLMYTSGFVNGLRQAMGTMMTIFIMYMFGSNTSLGIITSIIAVSTMVFLIMFAHFKFIKHRDITYMLMTILPFIACMFIVLYPTKVTLIIYNFVFQITSELLSYSLDNNKISMVKLMKYHGELLEHYVTSEVTLDFGRVLSFALMLIIGIYGGENTIYYLTISLIFYASVFVVLNIMNHMIYKKYMVMVKKHEQEKVSK